MNKKAFSLLLVIMMLAGSLAVIAPKVYANPTSIIVVPNMQEFGPASCVGTHFTITVEVHDVVNLYGVDIQFGWDETWIGYVAHQKKIPVETWPEGILHSPTIPVKDQVSEGVPMVGADPNSDYWLAEASMVPAAAFTGSGEAFEMEFVILQQGMPGDPDKTLTLNITTFTLANDLGNPITPVDEYDGTVVIHSRELVYPPDPKLSVLPEEVENLPASSTFVSEIWLHALDGSTVVDLDGFWDVAGFDIYVNFDPDLIEAVSVSVDPDGWFAAFWPNGIFIVKQEINNIAGTVWIVFLGIPGDLGVHTAPFGQGIIAEITFHTIYDSETYPPPSCAISLAPTVIAGFPHPERPYYPWFNSESAVPLRHFVNDATYTAFFMPPGAWIDVYCQYPDGFNGKGPNEPQDMYWPQKEVILYAEVTYNFWPEQQKDVAFQIMDPHGLTWAIICNRTNSAGIASISFRLPWPCDDPEYYFGVWTVIATVDVACKVVNDTLYFKYGYHVNVWKTTLDKEAYKHSEYIAVTIDYGTVSMQEFWVLFTVTGLDETGVPFAFAYTWALVGGADPWCTYANGTITLYIHVVKFARAGVGTIIVQALHNWPHLGGDSIYPTQYPETIVDFGILAEWA